VRNFDFPETLSQYRGWAERCGAFASCQPLCEVRFGKLVAFAS
jgi:hypothetical protein